MTTLFDDFTRTETRSAGNAEPHFTYLNTTARPMFAATRRRLERWFAEVPDTERNDLRRRFRSTDDIHHLAAFWELYLHEVMHRMGYGVACHPDVPGSSEHPDFLVSAPEGSFYLEATMAAGYEDRAGWHRRAEEVHDLLNRMNTPDFSVWSHVEHIGPQSPPVRRLRSELERWLSGLDADELLRVQDSVGLDALPTYRWQHQGWLATFTAHPRRPDLRGRPDFRPVGAHMIGGAGLRRDDVEIRNAVVQKARKYGDLDHPLVVALLGTSHFLDDLDVMEALFGSEEYLLERLRGDQHQRRHPRTVDGALLGPSGSRRQKVSAVVVAMLLMPWNMDKVEPTAWINPFAARPLLASLPFEVVMADATTCVLTRAEPRRGPSELLSDVDGARSSGG